MVKHIIDPSIQEAHVEGSRVQGQSKILPKQQNIQENSVPYEFIWLFDISCVNTLCPMFLRKATYE